MPKKTVTKKTAAKKTAAKKSVAKKAVKKSVAKKAAPAKKTATAKKTVAKKAAPVKKASTPVLPTTITAHVDVGFGNTLYLRGDGPGLSWKKGIVMDCVSDERWEWNTYEAKSPFEFKVLINDRDWAVGENETARPGKVTNTSPVFL
ncbi:MAG: hypothetical protein LAT55_07480 [Opitutales bacterium]|nr:hypothetical protein [Opitutales bacterium]